MSQGPDPYETLAGQKTADPFATVPPDSSSAVQSDPAHTPSPETGGPSQAPVKAGQVLLGQYQVKRKLGAGGMGSVWLVEDQVLKTDRALKLIASGLIDVPEARARFQREAQVMAKVKHEHAVIVHTAQLVGDTAAIVMEYIRGDSIDHLLRPGQPMPLDWAGQVLSQLCAVVQVAHDQGIVHRDLKPSNLMLVAGQPVGRVYLKVLDFGLAKILGSEVNDPITRSKGAMGTVAYLSPEQALGQEVDTRSDIYSLGVILFEFLVGQRPFDGPLYQVMNDHVKTPAPAFQTKSPGSRVPPEVERVVMQCLEKDPARRPASARELAETFLKAAGKSIKPRPEPKLEPQPKPEVQPKPKLKLKPRVLWAGAVAGGLALLVVLGILGRPHFFGAPPNGTLLFDFDAPTDGLEVKLDGDTMMGHGPFTIPSGPHKVVVMQGDFTAADEPITLSAGENPPVPIKVRRRAAVHVRPESATVSVDGKKQQVDKEGSLNLIFAGVQPLSVRARAEGHATFSKKLTFEDAAKTNFEIRLEPEKNRGAQLARSILKQHCHRCHGVDFEAPGLDVLDRNTLVSLRGAGNMHYLEPGKPAESAVWLQIEQGKMPPKPEEQMTVAEKAHLKAWIEDGAPPATEPRRAFLSEDRVVSVLRDDLRTFTRANARFYRYFTLTNLHNNPEVLEEELQLYRAALSKAINSLSREPKIVQPKAIDRDETIYRIDLREVVESLFDEFWPDLVGQYPYGFPDERGTGGDAAVQAISRRFYDLCATRQPYMRADWFVANATRPPLYPKLLALQNNAADLERDQNIDVIGDFKKDHILRAGVTKSRVARQNRVLERHGPVDGPYYWKSYDFRGSGADSELLRLPLGPLFEGHEFAEQAFNHTSSAIIFRLPNGLQGYMLVNAEGVRIENVDTEVLSDSQAASGSSKVVNGLSCMACHRLGLNSMKDNVRGGTKLPDKPQDKVELIYPRQEDIDEQVQKDRSAFLVPLATAIGPFLQSDDEKAPSVIDFPEPIEFVARRYRADLRLVDVASELGVENSEQLLTQIRETPQLRDLGLEPLTTNSTIKRQTWETSKAGVSLFQRVASELRRQARGRQP
jgi:serine/threonine protein kinase/mono/diheme cytochrome c family protein